MEPLTDAQRALVEAHMWLVKCIAGARSLGLPPSVERGDVEQAGYLGLMAAARRYEAGSAASFVTFARFRVNGAITDYLRGLDGASKEHRRRIKAEEAEEVVEVSLDSLRGAHSTGETPEEASMALEFSQQLRSLVEGLDGRDRTIIQQYYFQGSNMEQIADTLGVGTPRVSQLHTRILRRMAEAPSFVVRRQAFRFALTSGLLRRLGSAALGLVAAFLFTVSGVDAQTSVTPVSLVARGCAGPNVQIAVTVPLVAGTITVPVPVCAELGPGLTLNTTTSPPRIDITLPAVPYRAVVQKFAIPPIPDGINSASFNLTYVPHPASPILVSFASSRVGGNVVDSVMPAGGASPKVVQVSLPNYRPFTADDVLTIVYWTLDAP